MLQSRQRHTTRDGEWAREFRRMEITEATLAAMARDIARTANAEQVILFGSHARGDARPESDVDFLVVVSGQFGRDRSRRLLSAKISRALSRYRIPNDLLLYTSDEVARWRLSKNHLVSRTLEEGRTLYVRT